MCSFYFEVFSQSPFQAVKCRLVFWPAPCATVAALCLSEETSAQENFVTLQKHKHTLSEFLRNNQAFWFKLGGLLCEERERPRTTFSRSLQRACPGTPRDAISTTFLSLIIAHVQSVSFQLLTSHMRRIIFCSALCKIYRGPQEEKQLFFKSVNRFVALGFSLLVCALIFPSVPVLSRQTSELLLRKHASLRQQ